MGDIAPRLYHLALVDDWARADEGGYVTSTLGRTLADVGFIHCSFEHQVRQIADLVYRGRDDVVLLEIDQSRLVSPVHVDEVDGGDAFPHIYGPLNIDAVVRVIALPRLDDDGLSEVDALFPGRE